MMRHLALAPTADRLMPDTRVAFCVASLHRCLDEQHASDAEGRALRGALEQPHAVRRVRQCSCRG